MFASEGDGGLIDFAISRARQLRVIYEADYLKALVFLGLHFFVAFSIVFLLTGSFAVGGLAALIEPVANFFVFVLLDYYWDRD